jgi:hypothetical protein
MIRFRQNLWHHRLIAVERRWQSFLMRLDNFLLRLSVMFLLGSGYGDFLLRLSFLRLRLMLWLGNHRSFRNNLFGFFLSCWLLYVCNMTLRQ